MLFSRNGLLRGSQPLQAASRVVTASASATSLVARCWVHGTNRTFALVQTVRRRGLHARAYASRATNKSNDDLSSGIPFYQRLLDAWNGTPTKWYPLPIAVGALLLVAIRYRKKSLKSEKEVQLDKEGREVIRLKGPWQVHVLGALPLRNMSRLWGYLNSLELPVWFRPFGFRFYSLVFGCNLHEIDPPDLRQYASLGDFFYRKLRDGVRPVDKALLVSPADGKILHSGTIKDLRVEQVKGLTYSLDALLGVEPDVPLRSSVGENADSSAQHAMSIVNDREFANVNGIEYSLDQLLGVSPAASPGDMTPSSETSSNLAQVKDGEVRTDVAVPPTKYGELVDASVVGPESDLNQSLVHDASVALEMGVSASVTDVGASGRVRTKYGVRNIKDGNALFFAVIYLAPGDYHRFHSPTAWVVEKRRHFMGELFSVSPYMAKRLENLFVLNERVALLGRWRHGFFSMVPVGATNVGSIKVNFDKTLRTNVRVRGRPPPPGTYTEAVYTEASPLLRGQPLTPAQEMGGFCLGSTIVLVFEAPESFEFAVGSGDRVKVGQRLGDVPLKRT